MGMIVRITVEAPYEGLMEVNGWERNSFAGSIDGKEGNCKGGRGVGGNERFSCHLPLIIPVLYLIIVPYSTLL